MENQISILFDVYHLYHLAQFDPLIDLLENDDRFKIFFKKKGRGDRQYDSRKTLPAERRVSSTFKTTIRGTDSRWQSGSTLDQHGDG